MNSPHSLSRLRFLTLAIVATLPLLAGRAMAADIAVTDLQFAPLSIEDSIMLAQADATTANNETAYEAPVTKEKSFLSGKRIHQYLGLGSFAFAIAAAAAAPETEGAIPPSPSKKRTHKALGITAAALGGAAIANGFYVHGDDFNLDNGWTDPDNLHVLMTVLGTLGYAAAIATNGKGAHAAAGAGGAALMGVGIFLEW